MENSSKKTRLNRIGIRRLYLAIEKHVKSVLDSFVFEKVDSKTLVKLHKEIEWQLDVWKMQGAFKDYDVSMGYRKQSLSVSVVIYSHPPMEDFSLTCTIYPHE